MLSSQNFLAAAMLVAVVLEPAIAASETKPKLTSAEEVRTKADKYMSEQVRNGGFSGTVLVARNGQVLFSHAYGLANAEWGIPNSTSTVFRIGSLTKQFTAAAILLLQEDGALTVRDPICRYVTDCPQAWQPITIHNLLTHTSGIPDYTDAKTVDEYQSRAILPIKVEDLIDSLKHKPLEFAPGEKMKYSNSGYFILGHVIEKASGESYAAFLQQRIFSQLKLKDTGYDTHERIIERRAIGYSFRNGKRINSDYLDMSRPFAAGALYSTVEDLFAWNEALFTGHLLTEQSRKAMLLREKNLYDYGLIVLDDYHGHKLINHGGEINGFKSFLARYPNENVSIVALRNADYGEPDPAVIGLNLAAIVFGETYVPE